MRIFLAAHLIAIVLLSAGMVFAQEATYTPLVELPGMGTSNQTLGTEEYVHALYLLSITVAALLAVLKIIFGGVKWMLSDVVTDKSAAKKDIKGALLGLLIVLSAVLILNTINPNLTRLSIFDAAPQFISTGNGSGTQTENYPNYTIGSRLGFDADINETRHFYSSCAANGGSVEWDTNWFSESEYVCE